MKKLLLFFTLTIMFICTIGGCGLNNDGLDDPSGIAYLNNFEDDDLETAFSREEGSSGIIGTWTAKIFRSRDDVLELEFNKDGTLIFIYHSIDYVGDKEVETEAKDEGTFCLSINEDGDYVFSVTYDIYKDVSFAYLVSSNKFLMKDDDIDNFFDFMDKIFPDEF